jgi:hypothetical protein
MTGGSSGGPWLADFDPTTGAGTVVGVNASLGVPNTMGGTVFGPETRELLNQAYTS